MDTGMRRLGFEEKDVPALISILKKNSQVKVQSIFSHLVGSEAGEHDVFTKNQVARYKKMYARITRAIPYKPLRHILNSSGINRFPQHQMDMVRLGLSLIHI